VNGRLTTQQVSEISATYGVHKATGWRVWRRGQSSGTTVDVNSRIKGHSGGKSKYDVDDVEQRIKSVPIVKRQTYRALSRAVSIPKSTI
ncbi:hypothetical protein H310_15221, partial [Aphanomyces invadans]